MMGRGNLMVAGKMAEVRPIPPCPQRLHGPPDRLADCVVLDRNIFLVPPMEILEARVEAGSVAGTCAHAADGLDGDLS